MKTSPSIEEQRRDNLQRLLRPRHIAFIGGNTIAAGVQRCREFGFTGSVWLVNPNHKELQGIPCIPSVDALPEAPDAVFVGVPADASIEVVRALALRGAGGAVIYASGFAETGASGTEKQEELVKAAGPMAILGPNCYGLLDGLHGSALWPVGHGARRVDQGVAVITQSGNLAYNLSMSERAVPFGYLISIGNQAVVDVALLIEGLLNQPEIKAIGVHLEGLKDVPAFCRAATKALEMNVPIVALKVGTSQLGAKLAMSHTSSLAGSDELYAALFYRLGIIRAEDPAQFLETLKFLAAGRIPKGRRMTALATSGGDASLVADQGESAGIEFPALSNESVTKLRAILPDYATLANPLDFTTTPWGNREAMEICCDSVVSTDCDAALFVLDYPKESTGERPACNLAAHAFSHVCMGRDLPAAIVSVFPDLMPPEVAAHMAELGTPALQGLREGIQAIASSMFYGERRQQLLASGNLSQLKVLAAAPLIGQRIGHDEWESKELLRSYGLPLPAGVLTDPLQAPEVAQRLGFPVCAKIISRDLPHKTEMGAVTLKLNTQQEVTAAVERMRESVARLAPGVESNRILIEKMVDLPIVELIVGVKREENFGLALVIGVGGVLVELLRDCVTLLLPTNKSSVRQALLSLRLAPLMTGYRGRPMADIDAAVEAIMSIVQFASDNSAQIAELDVNPLFVGEHGAVATDALITMTA